MTQSAPVAGVVLSRSTDDGVAGQPEKVTVLAVLALAGAAVAFDVGPCGGLDIGELVGGQADYGAVSLVEAGGDVGETARVEGEGIGDLGRCPERRAGVDAEGVHV